MQCKSSAILLFRPNEIEETFKHRRVFLLRKTLVIALLILSIVIVSLLIAGFQL